MSKTRKLTKEELLAIVGGKADVNTPDTNGKSNLMSTYACFVFYCTYSTAASNTKVPPKC